MDSTFQTNVDGLLLGAIGPVGLWTRGKLPHMRFLPAIFMVADAEDIDAMGTLVDLLFQMRDGQGPQWSDGFLDDKCFKGAQHAIAKMDDPVCLHRCLQHLRGNVKAAAASQDPTSKEKRLQKLDLRGDLDEWIVFSAFLPNDEEFIAFWSHILERLKHNEFNGDLDEPAMAKYLEEHVLDVSGDLIKATGCSGLGTTPLGFTSYAPNSIEVSHRILKAMMGNGMRYQDIC
jgi:hypothetical protein